MDLYAKRQYIIKVIVKGLIRDVRWRCIHNLATVFS